MKFVIAGGTGFIGSHLLQHLTKQNHEVVLLTRSYSRSEIINGTTVKYVHRNEGTNNEWWKEINGSNIVINLAGKNLFENRWNKKVKQQLLNSRIIPTRLIVDAIANAEQKPQLFISASAIGYYGLNTDDEITEESPKGDDFLSYVVENWESTAFRAKEYGVRVAVPRIGLVLQKNGGVVKKLRLPFLWFIGGPVGTKNQILSWIHMEDVIRGILYPIENVAVDGIYNLVSPQPVPMKRFSDMFGKILHRPSWLPVPEFALTVLYGEGAKAILAGQKVIPKKLLQNGFQFTFSNLENALRDILH